ncbi:uncharacterized protein LOC129727966 [Wyeomyia smithii]|uniref:uncharacterized protein LOC129727966 n=1 Tax=Wyeomyia smithii TaxID=174621 RepID=UPI002467E632|nr:uncharacterized protein LOC129727966 [Wyeomyia smithii]
MPRRGRVTVYETYDRDLVQPKATRVGSTERAMLMSRASNKNNNNNSTQTCKEVYALEAESEEETKAKIFSSFTTKYGRNFDLSYDGLKIPASLRAVVSSK